ncbi:MAG: carboxypeptidase regulatory-like domain-containing protein, partial [Acidobacteriota bacterium]
MRFTHLRSRVFATIALLPLLLTGIILVVGGAPGAHAQSMLAGDIAGTVMDPSGAAVVGATVTAKSRATGAAIAQTTSATGAYRFSLLSPGTYTLSASAPGFKSTSTTVTVAIGQITTQALNLAVGSASETVEVSASAQLLQTDTASLTSSVTLDQIQNLPNPGSDITYEAQAKPGVVMNTGANSSSGTLGYGNFSAFGLPGTSNNFTENGMEVNDPFLNLNNSGPSNMLLGLNDVQETDVVTNAYDTEYGTLAGVQLNAITRSGGDKFHGNLNYGWNGRVMNANDWFNKNPLYASPAIGRPFSNFNQWAGAVGGPIKKQKVFFFFNTEGISFITSSQNIVHLPSPTFESDSSYPTTGNLRAC